jgi:ankyrin repeat protein
MLSKHPPKPRKQIALFLQNSDLRALANTSKTNRFFTIKTLSDNLDDKNLNPFEKQLFIAAYLGLTDLVKEYLELGVNVNVRLDIGENNFITPIHYAALSGILSCVKLLKEFGANYLPEKPTKYFTSPLHFAAAGGNPKCVEYFLDLGVPVNQESSWGCPVRYYSTALEIAVSYGHSNCLSLLIARGGNVHEQDGEFNQPIHSASAQHDIVCVRILLGAQADPNAQNEDGWTPLSLGIQKPNNDAVILELLKRNANPRFSCMHFRFIMPFQRTIINKDLSTALVFLQFDPTLIDARFKFDGKVMGIMLADFTALHHAARMGYEEGVIFLLAHNANSNIKTCSGERAIDMVKDKNSAIVKLLEDHRLQYDLRKKTQRERREQRKQRKEMRELPELQRTRP